MDIHSKDINSIQNLNHRYFISGIAPECLKDAITKVIKELGAKCIIAYHYFPKVLPQTYIVQRYNSPYDNRVFNYRRFQVEDALKHKYKNRVMVNPQEYVKPTISVCSDVRGCVMSLIEKEAFGKDVTLIYDRTDNWSGQGMLASRKEQLLFQYADKITCSSYYLYESIPDKFKHKASYIPNGNFMLPYKNVKKFDDKTAIYVGNGLGKIKLPLLYKLADNNKDWKFLIYTKNKDEDNIRNNVFFHEPKPLEELFSTICKCHLGLILFENNEFTKGMLPLKFFNYINAKIPVAITANIADNLRDYKDCISIIELLNSLDETQNVNCTYSKYERDWSVVMNELLKEWGI